MTYRRRRRRRHYPHAYARMTLRGPRVGINWLPGIGRLLGVMIWLTVAMIRMAAAIISGLLSML